MPRLVVRPLEHYLEREAGSASLLMAAALSALVWANIAPGSYENLWAKTVGIDVALIAVEGDLRNLINDLLMAVFFYVVALEVKRELLFGSLREWRTAAVPAAAALGTMVGAAATYLAVNLIGGGDPRGWAIPIATDIAFAVGVLGLAGSRAPRELRAFLLTLAVVDDLATIAVIAVFFTQQISFAWLGAAAGLAFAIGVLRRIGVLSLVPYLVLAAALWLAVFESGVHATISGVLLGFLTPAVAFHSRRKVGEAIHERLDDIVSADQELSEATALRISRLAQDAVSPLARMEERLHPWSAYLILPLFALANAGVPLSIDRLGEAVGSPIGLGVFLGLVVGAPAGGMLLAWLIVAVSPAALPERLDWPAIGGVAPLKGIGFTIAIFIAGLTFEDQALHDQVIVSILAASATAAALGLAILYARAFLGAKPRSEPPGVE